MKKLQGIIFIYNYIYIFETWVNECFLYTKHENVHTKTCVFTVPDACTQYYYSAYIIIMMMVHSFCLMSWAGWWWWCPLLWCSIPLTWMISTAPDACTQHYYSAYIIIMMMVHSFCLMSSAGSWWWCPLLWCSIPLTSMISTLNGGGKESHIFFKKTHDAKSFTHHLVVRVSIREREKKEEGLKTLPGTSRTKPLLWMGAMKSADFHWLNKKWKNKTSCPSWSVAASERPVPNAPGCGSNRQWKASAWGSSIPGQM